MEMIPSRMQAIVLDEYREPASAAVAGLRVAERDVPQPAHGQVLVKIEAAPCNPSDVLLLQGKYGVRKSLPAVPGWEGAGTVVANGGGILGGWLVGKRVACGVQGDRSGTWAQYCVADANQCIPLKRQLDIEQAASLIVNPLTAVGLLDTAQRNGHASAIHTGGASQLGRMLLRLAQDAKFPLVSVVRRQEQVELLKSLGAQHVLNSSDDDFTKQLAEIAARLKATVAFDAVGGEMTGTLFNALPAKSMVYVYGALSEEPCGAIDPVQLIFHEKSIDGFFLASWLKARGVLGTLMAARKVQQLLIDGTIATKIQRRLSLAEVPTGLQQYLDQMTAGKVLIKPNG